MCYEEPTPGTFTKDDTIGVMVRATGVDLGKDDQDAVHIERISFEEKDSKKPLFVMITTVKVRSSNEPVLKERLLEYYIVKKTGENVDVVWGPYDLDIPQEPFEGTIGVVVFLKDTDTLAWDTVRADYTDYGYAVAAVAMKPKSPEETARAKQ